MAAELTDGRDSGEPAGLGQIKRRAPLGFLCRLLELQEGLGRKRFQNFHDVNRDLRCISRNVLGLDVLGALRPPVGILPDQQFKLWGFPRDHAAGSAFKVLGVVDEGAAELTDFDGGLVASPRRFPHGYFDRRRDWGQEESYTEHFVLLLASSSRCWVPTRMGDLTPLASPGPKVVHPQQRYDQGVTRDEAAQSLSLAVETCFRCVELGLDVHAQLGGGHQRSSGRQTPTEDTLGAVADPLDTRLHLWGVAKP